MSADICEYLDWDSDFFEVNIARANIHQLNLDTIKLINTWCQEQSIDCLYFLANTDDTKTIRIAEDQGFRLVEIRLTLDLKLSKWKSENYPSTNPNISVRPARLEDIPVLQNIVKDIYVNTRFYVDENFREEKCQEFYQTWIKNICEGRTEMALVAETDGQVQGIIAGHKYENIGQFDIAGVRREAQGSGIGSELVRSGTEWYANHGVEYIWFYTQGRNTITQRLFQRYGYLTRNCQLYYHKWFSDH